MTSELKVGVFTTVALGVLAYMIIATGSCRSFFRKQEGYHVTAKFTSIAGLERRAAVRIAGVRVGEVLGIALNDEGIAEVGLIIAGRVQLHKDASAAVSSLGLMGEKYVEIFPGSPDQTTIKDGATITGKPPMSIDQMGSQILSISGDIKVLTTALSTALGSEEGQARLKSIITNLANFTDQLQGVLTDNREGIGHMIRNADLLTIELRRNLQQITDRVDKTLGTVQQMLEENRDNVHSTSGDVAQLAKKLQDTSDSLNNILKKIDQGEGTLGKLVNEPTTHDKLNKALDQIDKSLKDVSSTLGKVGGMPQPHYGLRTEYLADTERAKTYLSFSLQSKKNRYFLMELVHDPSRVEIETRTTTGSDGLQRTIRTETVHQAFSLTAQGGIHLGPLGFRGGITESTAGLGLDYSLANDRLRFSLDGYDFGRGDQPHLKVGTQFGILKNVFLSVGGDDLLRDHARQFFFGAGIGQ